MVETALRIGLIGVLAFSVLSPAAAQSRTAAVPLQRFRSGHIGVQVRVNGRGPFRLILDTGSPVTFISTRAAKSLGISPGTAAGAGMFGMGMAVNPFAHASSFAVGGAEVKDLGIMVLDHPVIEMLGTVEGPVDGIVGFTFFSRFRTTIDYSAGRLTLSPNGYEPVDVVKNILGILMNRGGSQRVVAPAALWGFVLEDSADGPVVKTVYAGSPAADAGLRPGDRLSIVNGRWIESTLGFFEQSGGIRPGATARLTVIREGHEQSLMLRPRVGI